MCRAVPSERSFSLPIIIRSTGRQRRQSSALKFDGVSRQIHFTDGPSDDLEAVVTRLTADRDYFQKKMIQESVKTVVENMKARLSKAYCEGDIQCLTARFEAEKQELEQEVERRVSDLATFFQEEVNRRDSLWSVELLEEQSQADSYHRLIDALQKELLDLKTALLERDVQNAEDEVKNMETDNQVLGDARMSMTLLDSENDALEGKVAVLTSENVQLQNLATETSRQVHLNAKKMSKMRCEIEMLGKGCFELGNDKEELLLQLKSQKKEADETIQRMATNVRNLESKELQIQQINENLMSNIQELEGLKVQLELDLEQTTERSNQQLQRALEIEQHLTSAIRDLHAEKLFLESTLAQLRTDKDDEEEHLKLTIAMLTANVDATNDGKARLESTLKETCVRMETQQQESQDRILTLTKKVESLEEQKRNNLTLYMKLESMLERLHQEKECLEQEARATITKLTDDLHCNRLQQKHLEASLARLQNDKDTQQQESHENMLKFSSEIASLQGKNEMLEEHLRALQLNMKAQEEESKSFVRTLKDGASIAAKESAETLEALKCEHVRALESLSTHHEVVRTTTRTRTRILMTRTHMALTRILS